MKILQEKLVKIGAILAAALYEINAGNIIYFEMVASRAGFWFSDSKAAAKKAAKNRENT